MPHDEVEADQFAAELRLPWHRIDLTHDRRSQLVEHVRSTGQWTAGLKSQQCPLWVISGHTDKSSPCPLCPQKQTFVGAGGMSAKCQKRTCVDKWRNEFVPESLLL
jgi:hypothetical protein